MTVAEPPTPVPAAKASTFEDFVDIWYKPAAVFERRQPVGFWTPFLVVTALTGIIIWFSTPVMQPIYESVFNQGAARIMARNPQMTPEMMDRARATMTRFFPVFAVIGTPFRVFTLGLFLWLCGKLVKATEGFGTALGVAAFASLPRILESLIYAVQAALMDPTKLDGPSRLMIGPSRFVDPASVSPIVVVLLSRLDLFTIWVLVLVTIGLSVTGRIPRGRAWAATAVLWVLGTLAAVGGALRGG
jgi:hypothetical protein